MEAPDRGVSAAVTGCPPERRAYPVPGPRDRAGGHGISLEQATVVQPTTGEVSGYRAPRQLGFDHHQGRPGTHFALQGQLIGMLGTAERAAGGACG